MAQDRLFRVGGQFKGMTLGFGRPKRARGTINDPSFVLFDAGAPGEVEVGENYSHTGTYNGTPAEIEIQWFNGETPVGSAVNATKNAGTFSFTIAAPASPAAYTLRASFDGAAPTNTISVAVWEYSISINPIGSPQGEGPVLLTGGYGGPAAGMAGAAAQVVNAVDAPVGDPIPITALGGAPPLAGTWTAMTGSLAAAQDYAVRVTHPWVASPAVSNRFDVEAGAPETLGEFVFEGTGV
jgi:hypothetical protein